MKRSHKAAIRAGIARARAEKRAAAADSLIPPEHIVPRREQLVKALGKIAPKKTEDEIRAWVATKSMVEVNALFNSPKVRAVLTGAPAYEEEVKAPNADLNASFHRAQRERIEELEAQVKELEAALRALGRIWLRG